MNILTNLDVQEKVKLSFDEMIDHLDFKGVEFKLVSKDDAKNILEHSNYFYKITAFRNNFYKNEFGKYINLDFGYLSDLATIDMRLRYIVLQMCLDIEHGIKTKILSDITNNPTEDGYSIVKAFFKHDKTDIDHYMKPLTRESHHNHGIYNKYNKNIPLWVLFEVSSFGNLSSFTEFYYLYTNKSEDYFDLFKTLKHVRNIRNLAAHNSPLLMDVVKLGQLKISPVRPIVDFLKQIPTISKDVRRKRLSNRKTHDITALFFVYNSLELSETMKKTRYQSLDELLKRSLRLKENYIEQEHNGLRSTYNYFANIIDFLQNE